MEPNFVINTVVSEQDYRRGLRYGVEYPMRFLWIVLFLYVLIRDFRVLIKYGYYLSYSYLLILVLTMALCVYFIVHNIMLPKKLVQKNIDQQILLTGSPSLDNEIKFYNSELTVKSRNEASEAHIPFAFIEKIVIFDTFIMLQSKQNAACYIAKSDIQSYHDFINYLISVCPNAKIINK
jgi:hypothetical protein